MENELRNHKKSDSFKWFLTLMAFIIVGVTLAGIILGWFTPKTDNTDDNTPSTEQTETADAINTFATEFVNTQNVRLMSAGPMMMAANSAYVEQNLTATVLPATATNKKVDWSVAWADGQSGTVTDYVTVTPSADGSTTASVKCYKAFTGNVVITVTTRESGYTAECVVTFVGVPTDLTATGTFAEASDGYYYFGVGDTYTYNVDLNNIFGTVGVDYQDINMSFGAYGSVVLGTYEYYSQSGTSKWYDTSLTTVTLDSLKDNFMSVSYADGVLSITTVKTIESYYESMSRIDGGRTRSYTNKFKEYATDDAYFYVKLTQPDSGLEKLMKIKFDETVVAGVDVNNTQIYF